LSAAKNSPHRDFAEIGAQIERLRIGARWQMFFNRVNQLWNADRFRN
jgi:hypothetical protein